MNIYPLKAFSKIEDSGQESFLNPLIEKNQEKFYCIKLSKDNEVFIGLMGLISLSEFNKRIFFHERIIKSKCEKYIEIFLAENQQYAPITIMHEDCPKIADELLKDIKTVPCQELRVDDCLYQLWPLADIAKYQKLYSSITSFLLLDGHHRVNALLSINGLNYVNSFIVSNYNACAKPIYRTYNNISNQNKRILQDFLEDNFVLKKFEALIMEDFENFVLYFPGCETYEVIGSNSNIQQRIILEFLEKNLNYKEKNINFINSSFVLKDFQNLFLANNSFSVLIPANKIEMPIRNLNLYPPHSTFYFPKIPKSLVTYNFNF